ncbi:MAG: hypothetical protein D6722_06375, partial [Bacteroidetes bacterium]
MIDLQKLTHIHIKLRVGEADLLGLMMSRSGTLNRLGDGEDEQPPFFMGRTEEPLFEEFVAQLSPELLELTGRYTFPDQQGVPCELVLALAGEGIDTGFA